MTIESPMTHRTARSMVVLYWFAAALRAAVPGTAHASTSSVPLTDPISVYPIPSVPRPKPLVPVIEPDLGTTITRITGDTGTSTFPVSGTWGADARHTYSKQQPWNADQTLLAVQNRSGGTPSILFLDGTNYLPRFGGGSPLYDYRWHPSRAYANTMINVNSAGTELMWYDVVTGTKSRSWTLPITVDYGIGSGEGNPSNDGRFVCLANATGMFVVDMDPQPPYAAYPAKRIGPVYSLVPCGLDPANPGACAIGNVSIAPSGKYVDVKFSSSDPVTQDMHRIFDVDPATLELRPHPMDATALRCDSFQARADGWIFPLKHADMALDPFDNNEDVIVGGRSCPGSTLGHVVKVRLRDGKVTSLTNPSNEPSFQHASARNLDRPGWVYVGFYKADGKKFNDEIVAVKLDGSGQVERWSHKRSTSSGCYRCESHPVPSRDGRRVLFASNWSNDCGGTCGPSTDIKDYVVSVPVGPVAVGDPEPGVPGVPLALAGIVPTPSVSRCAVRFTLGQAAHVAIDLVDAAGRVVRSRDLGDTGAGPYEVNVERAGLKPGVYWVRVSTGHNVVTGKVIFVG